MILIYGYGSTGVLPLTCLSAWCTLPLLDLNTRANPCSKTWQDIAKVQTLGGIVLMGGDFNVCIATLSDTINISDLCELLQVPELVRTEQSNIMTKRQNRDASVSSWGRKLLNLCCDAGLFILNGRTPSDELREFTCLANGGCSIIDYIVGSPTI
jgi:hypothetical protein